MKKPLSALAAILLYGASASAVNVQTCTIKTMPKQNPNFLMFPSLPQLPQLGDEIELDLDATEITDLTFKSGTAIAIKQKGAKLVRRQGDTEMGLSSFKGTFQSPTGDYTGVAYFYTADKSGKNPTPGSLEISRLKFLEGFDLVRYGLECKIK